MIWDIQNFNVSVQPKFPFNDSNNIDMAELHVQRKKGGFIWLWIILMILLIAGGVYYYMHSQNPETYPLPAKTTAN